MAIALAGACGSGSGSGGDTPPATITISTAAGPQGGVVPIAYELAGSGAWDVRFAFSRDGGATWIGAQPAAGCPATKQRSAPGSYSYAWDTVADGASGPVILRASIPESSSQATTSIANAGLAFLDRSATIDAAVSPLTMRPVHGGHYDLSPTRLDYSADPAFIPLATAIPVRSWRISVGRWEIGPVALLAPEPACWSNVPDELRTCSREFYRGPNTLAGAADPANYAFGYLDAALAAVRAAGAEPYLCFDYMPFTLASNQTPGTVHDHFLADPNQSFSNGIRTSPPLDVAVYAEVVKHVVMHVKGSFAGGLNQPLTWVEIGNEPDLPLTYFWTGTRAQFLAMYQACANALAAEFGTAIRIAAPSFAWVPGEADPTFMQDFLSGLATTRLDAVGVHAYQDVPETSFFERLVKARLLRNTFAPNAELHVPEWGMVLDGGPEFDDMTAAIHHAKALVYFLLFDVSLAHRALVRDVVAAPGGIGLLHAGPARTKPAAHVFAAFERLYGTPALLTVAAQAPAGKPMILAGKNANEVTVLFFHEAPPPGQVGRFALSVGQIPLPSWTVERRILTDATHDLGDGAWLQETRVGSGDWNETIHFTAAVLVEWRLRAQ